MNALTVIVNLNLVSKVDLKTGVTRAILTVCKVGVFFERNITTLENTPTPPLWSHLSSSPMGVFSRDYSTMHSVSNWTHKMSHWPVLLQ